MSNTYFLDIMHRMQSGSSPIGLRSTIGVSVYRDTIQIMADSPAIDMIQWQGRHYDGNDMWESAQPTRLYINTSGLWRITATLATYQDVHWHRPSIHKNGVKVAVYEFDQMEEWPITLSVSIVLRLTAGPTKYTGDYIECGLEFNATGSNRGAGGIGFSANVGGTTLYMERISD